MNLPHGAPGRLLALALLLIPLALLFRLAIQPAVSSYQTQSERIDLARDQLDKFQRLAAQLPVLQRNVAYLQDQDLLAPYLIDANNSALAAAAVQQRLKELAKDQNGQVQSTRVMKSTPDGPFERVVVNARLQIPLDGLQALLHGLETGQPYLFFQDVSISYRKARSRRRAQQQLPGGLDTRLTVYGLRRSIERSQPSA